MKVVLEHLTKRFPSRNKKDKTEVVAVNDMSFEIPDGKLVGLLGPSGCGKSTVLNLICGLETPTEGRILFGEDDVTGLPPERRGVGLVFQNYALYPHLTVRQNILFPLQNLRGEAKLSKEAMEEKMLAAAKLVQIEQLLERKPSEMSGGQQQHARLRLQTREEIRRIQRETGVTTVFVTHDQEEAMSISDIIVVMKEGVLQQTGRPQEVYNDPANLFVAKFLGTPPINVFDGEVRGGTLYVGPDAVMELAGVADRPVTVGIRPEAFRVRDDGPLRCALETVEVMGRDTTIVSTHSALQGVSIRSVISAEYAEGVSGGEVRFYLKCAKVHLFDPESGERIRFTDAKAL